MAKEKPGTSSQSKIDIKKVGGMAMELPSKPQKPATPPSDPKPKK